MTETIARSYLELWEVQGLRDRHARQSPNRWKTFSIKITKTMTSDGVTKLKSLSLFSKLMVGCT